MARRNPSCNLDPTRVCSESVHVKRLCHRGNLDSLVAVMIRSPGLLYVHFWQGPGHLDMQLNTFSNIYFNSAATTPAFISDFSSLLYHILYYLFSSLPTPLFCIFYFCYYWMPSLLFGLWHWHIYFMELSCFSCFVCFTTVNPTFGINKAFLLP